MANEWKNALVYGDTYIVQLAPDCVCAIDNPLCSCVVGVRVFE